MRKKILAFGLIVLALAQLAEAQGRTSPAAQSRTRSRAAAVVGRAPGEVPAWIRQAVELDRYPEYPEKVFGQDYVEELGLKACSFGETESALNFNRDKGKYALDKIPAGEPAWCDAEGWILYIRKCANRVIFLEDLEPLPPPPVEPEPVGAPPLRRPPESPPPPPPTVEAVPQEPIPEEPVVLPETRWGVTGGISLGQFSSRPIAGTIHSLTDWTVCIDGRGWNLGVAWGNPKGSFWRFTLARNGYKDESFTRRKGDALETIAVAQGVSVTGFRAERVFRFNLKDWPVAPVIAASAGLGWVSGDVILFQRPLAGNFHRDEAGGEKLFNSGWQPMAGVGGGIAANIGDKFTILGLVAGIEYPGVYWKGQIQAVYNWLNRR